MNIELNCSALNCVHNLSGLCSANRIHVIGAGAHDSRQTMCETFAPKGFKNAVTHVVNSNVAGEIKQLFTTSSIEMSPIIKCEAINCIYNEERICKASNVMIYGSTAVDSSGTQCETFRG